MKKVIVLILICSLCMIPNQKGKAAAELDAVEQDKIENNFVVYNAYSESINTRLNISNKSATLKGIVKGVPGTTTKIIIKLTLQKYENGSWSSVQTYEKTVKATNGSLSKTKTVSSGKYRIKGVYSVYKGSKVEKTTQYSTNVSC